MRQRTGEDRGAVTGGASGGPRSGSGQMGAVLTQGCLDQRAVPSLASKGSRPSCSARRAWELDPEQLTGRREGRRDRLPDTKIKHQKWKV